MVLVLKLFATMLLLTEKSCFQSIVMIMAMCSKRLTLKLFFFSKSALSDRCAMVALEQVHMYFAE